MSNQCTYTDLLQNNKNMDLLITYIDTFNKHDDEKGLQIILTRPYINYLLKSPFKKGLIQELLLIAQHRNIIRKICDDYIIKDVSTLIIEYYKPQKYRCAECSRECDEIINGILSSMYNKYENNYELIKYQAFLCLNCISYTIKSCHVCGQTFHESSLRNVKSPSPVHVCTQCYEYEVCKSCGL